MSTSYDELAYPSRPFQQTHPLRLATAAALFGLPFAPIPSARILEIGCGEGANIVPMALSYPDSKIVGFDLADSAVAVGRDIVGRLGLTNIQLLSMDILATGPELGQFDYIIAHGVYSWVPEPVREALLALVSACLAPNGLAFVSYNAMPGGHLRLLMREMLTHHLRGVTGIEARLGAAHQFLNLYIDTAPTDDPISEALRAYAKNLLTRDPRVLFHDELGEVFAPFYLHEFTTAADRHGLKFLAEGEGLWWREELFPSSRGKAIMEVAGNDPLELHQYLDFIVSRLFHQTILCRSEQVVDRNVDHRRARQLWATSHAEQVGDDVDLQSRTPVRFEFHNGAAISLDDPNLKQALFAIGAAWPQAVQILDLPDHPDVDEGLLQLFTAGHIELSVAPALFATKAGTHPLASPLARLQLADGAPMLTGLDHGNIKFDDAQGRHFLSLLNGHRSRQDLVAEMIRSEQVATLTLDQVDRNLERLAHLCLLLA